MPRKQGQDSTQFGLFATPLEAMIAADNDVQLIKALVDRLDLDDLGFARVKSQGRGRYASDLLLNGGEWSLIATGYNLRRSMSIAGIPLLIEWLEGAKTAKNRLKCMVWELSGVVVAPVWTWFYRASRWLMSNGVKRVNLVGVWG